VRPARVAPALFALLLVTAWGRAADNRQISGQELVKLGFFQDFDELNLEDLLSAGDVKTALASFSERTVEEAPGVISIVSAEEIQAMGARTLEDVLRRLPGFDVLTDSLGRTRVVMRGILPSAQGRSDTVLILANGHPLNEAVTGGATVVNLDLPVDTVKRIEILRGPGSALYGSGALLGVINIVGAGVEDYEGIGLAAGLGSFGTRRVVLRLGNTLKGVGVAGSLNFLDTDGARLLVPEDAQTLRDSGGLPPAAPGGLGLRPVSLAPGRTTDRLQALQSSYRITYQSLALNLRLKNENAGGYVGLADALGTQNDLNNRQFAVDLSYARPWGSGTLRGALSYTSSEDRELLEVFPPGYARREPDGTITSFPSGILLQTALNSRRYALDGQLDRRLGGHELTGGLVFAHHATFDLDARSNFDFARNQAQTGLEPLPGVVVDAKRDLFGVYAQDVWGLTSRVTLTAGARWDHGSDFGDSVNPRAALVVGLPRDLTLKLLYGRSFRAPSFSELYFQLPGYTGNPVLRPESAQSLEAALTYKKRDLQLTANGFLTRVRNSIGVQRPYDPLVPQTLINLPGVDAHGVEVELRRSFSDGHALFASLTYQRPEDPVAGARLADVPSVMASFGASFNFRDRYTATATAALRGSRLRAAGDTRPELPGNGLVNLHLRARNVYRSLELTGSVVNLFGTAYADPAPLGGVPGDYPRPGRRVLFMAGYKF
jgi:outer membrane receptor protein involved in Fe transport